MWEEAAAARTKRNGMMAAAQPGRNGAAGMPLLI